jgi:hypothetical protein
MQFIKNGPDIPERLLQTHEEGRVVFFCGAGISYPAGLPGFAGLVHSLYEHSGVTPDPVQQAALEAHQYDTAIALLEDRHVGGRMAVRRELSAILTAAKTSRKATLTHEALLDCLVVSSGDFGLAYLTERWAARFVSELFRHYTVCFVGYSLNDPVLRYMMDALAADRQRGEAPLEMYAFGSYTKSREAAEAEWRAKNVTPILYEETEDHRYLHKTLHSWSETYRDGARGKELIIVKEAI